MRRHRARLYSLSGMSAATASKPARKARVMVIDDEPDTVMTLLEILRDEGFEAEGYSSSHEAVRNVASFRPDVVISDLAMPAPHGFDVAREIRNILGDKPLLIAVTGQYTKKTE